MSFPKKYFPGISVAACALALGIQAIISHRFHQMDREFQNLKNLKAELDKHLEVYNKIRLERIDELDKQIDRLANLH